MTGCSRSISLFTVEIPAELKHCAPEPLPPVGAYDAGQAAQYVVDLREAGRDCRAVVNAVGLL